MQQGDDPKPTIQSTKQWLKQKKIKYFCSDLNHRNAVKGPEAGSSCKEAKPHESELFTKIEGAKIPAANMLQVAAVT